MSALLPDLIATAALWLVALAAMLLIFNQRQPVLGAPGSDASSNADERNRTVADQPDCKCLLIPED